MSWARPLEQKQSEAGDPDRREPKIAGYTRRGGSGDTGERRHPARDRDEELKDLARLVERAMHSLGVGASEAVDRETKERRQARKRVQEFARGEREVL